MWSIEVPIWELVLRGTATYWFLFLLFRFVIRRDGGSFAIADVLLVVLIADASQNAMSGGYTSLTEGAIVVGTIVAWNRAIDWSAYHWPAVRRFTEPPPLVIVQQGRMMRRNMRKELLTEDELLSQMRSQGIERLEQVKLAYLEADGSITMIQYAER